MTTDTPSPEELNAIDRARRLLQESIAFRTNVTESILNEVQKREVGGNYYRYHENSEPRLADRRCRLRLSPNKTEQPYNGY